MLTARVLTSIAMLILAVPLKAQVAVEPCDDSDARPPVAGADLRIVKRAKQILDSPKKWNRADTRECPAGAKTFNLYCALEKATEEVSGNFEHRGAAMQEARFAIEKIAPNLDRYDHRLMDYNNDPTTSFAIFKRCSVCWKAGSRSGQGRSVPTASARGLRPAAIDQR